MSGPLRSKSGRLTANDNADGSGFHYEPVDPMAQFEGPVYCSIRIQGDQKILHQKVEGFAIDLDAGDLDALHLDLSASIA